MYECERAKELRESLKGYRKVSEYGGTYVVDVFWNPVTEDEKRFCARDYDYDATHDIGDTVEVFKGRKIPVGTIAVIKEFRDWKDQYGRVQTVYAVFEDGRRTNVDNCRLVKGA